MTRAKSQRHVYRRGSDSRWHIWWPILVTVATFLFSLLGVYIGVSNQLAVQRVEIANLQRSSDGVKVDLKDRIDSLQRNFEGIQRYLVDLHNNEERRTR